MFIPLFYVSGKRPMEAGFSIKECLYMLGWIRELICNTFLYCYTLYTKTTAYILIRFYKKKSSYNTVYHKVSNIIHFESKNWFGSSCLVQCCKPSHRRASRQKETCEIVHMGKVWYSKHISISTTTWDAILYALESPQQYIEESLSHTSHIWNVL